jgi:hypothetical protein
MLAKTVNNKRGMADGPFSPISQLELIGCSVICKLNVNQLI